MKDDKIFLDNNILVYAYDKSAGAKHDKALAIVRNLWDFNLGVVSTQVLQEFFVNVTRKLSLPLNPDIAKNTIKDLLTWKPVIINGALILKAIDLHSRHKYSFWDSLIIAAAVTGGAKIILSEDLADSQTIQGITIKNPFK
ncbi:MAG: PIN domain-containing protein [Nitrospirae bacterium]|nr:PIN domain-containing protein [Nitrospirota bacterium]